MYKVIRWDADDLSNPTKRVEYKCDERIYCMQLKETTNDGPGCLFVGDRSRKIIQFDLETRIRIQMLPCQGEVFCMHLSTDMRFLYSGDRKNVSSCATQRADGCTAIF